MKALHKLMTISLLMILTCALLTACGGESAAQSAGEPSASDAPNPPESSRAAIPEPAPEKTPAPKVAPDGVFTVTSITVLGTLGENDGVSVQGQYSGVMKNTGYQPAEWFLDSEVTNLALGKDAKLVTFGDKMSLVTGENLVVATVRQGDKEHEVEIAQGMEFDCVLKENEVRLLLDIA